MEVNLNSIETGDGIYGVEAVDGLDVDADLHFAADAVIHSGIIAEGIDLLILYNSPF